MRYAGYYWNLLFGNIAGFQATFSQMGVAIQEIPDEHYFALAGLGQDQQTVAAAAISMGYGVRIGLEDNIWLDRDRTTLAANIDLVQRVHNLIELQGHECMEAKEFGDSGFYNRSDQ